MTDERFEEINALVIKDLDGCGSKYDKSLSLTENHNAQAARLGITADELWEWCDMAQTRKETAGAQNPQTP